MCRHGMRSCKRQVNEMALVSIRWTTTCKHGASLCHADRPVCCWLNTRGSSWPVFWLDFLLVGVFFSLEFGAMTGLTEALIIFYNGSHYAGKAKRGKQSRI